MTHYLLNDFDVCFVFAKPCAKRMAKNVAAEMRDDNGFSAFFIYKYESAHAAYRRRRETSFLPCHCQRVFCFP